jgi:hypothetical protein
MPISRFVQSELLLAVVVLVSVSSATEARRWRHHVSFGFYEYYDRNVANPPLPASKQAGHPTASALPLPK